MDASSGPNNVLRNRIKKLILGLNTRINLRYTRVYNGKQQMNRSLSSIIGKAVQCLNKK